jgi:predicted type IV restriction endonuclease
MRHSYPSDISRDQFEKIRPILESSRKQTRPRTIDLYDVFCGVLYILKSGCQWRMLPIDYPKWRSCHHYFSIWSEKKDDETDSILEQVLKKIGRKDTYQGWSGGENELHHYRCPERQKHRHRREKRV